MLRKFIRRLRGCPVCANRREVLHFGNSAHAELRACSWCDDGHYIAETTIPTVQRA